MAVLLKAAPGALPWLWQGLLVVGALALLRGLVYLMGMRRNSLPEAQFQQGQTQGQPRLSERQWRALVAAQMNAYRILGGLAVLLCLVYWGFLPASARL